MFVLKSAYCSAVCPWDISYKCNLSLNRIDFSRPSLIQGFFWFKFIKLDLLLYNVFLDCFG